MVVWWRNYIVLACAIVPYEPPRAPFQGSPSTPYNPATVKHNNTHFLISRIRAFKHLIL